jgi:hypothetical protein
MFMVRHAPAATAGTLARWRTLLSGRIARLEMEGRARGGRCTGSLREVAEGEPATRGVVFAHLRTILGAAVDDERMAKNPCSARSVKQPRPTERRAVPWRLEQAIAIRRALAPRYRGDRRPRGRMRRSAG